MPPVIRPATPSDLPAAAQLLEQQLGQQIPPTAGVIVAVDEDRVVGVMTYDTLEHSVPDDRLPLVQAVVPADPIFLKAGAVHPGHRRKGVAAKLAKKIIDLHPGREFAATAWVKKGHAPAGAALEENGFTTTLDIHAYWRKQNQTAGAICPEDGSSCACAARVYIRR